LFAVRKLNTKLNERNYSQKKLMKDRGGEETVKVLITGGPGGWDSIAGGTA
jgi:hypothetical protein